MLRLKATKTSLYELAAYFAGDHEWFTMPPRPKTEFIKAPGRPDYFLQWRADGYLYQVFLAAVFGKVSLTFERWEQGKVLNKRTYRLDVQELRERGMVEEKPKRP